MSLYQFIKDGFDRDVIVYDTDSNGRLTKRLICLLIGFAQLRGIKPEKMFIDTSQISEIMVFLPYMECWPDVSDGKTYTIFGIPVEFVVGLDCTSGEGKVYLDFYKNMGGQLMHSRNSLIVLASKDKAILGCY